MTSPLRFEPIADQTDGDHFVLAKFDEDFFGPCDGEGYYATQVHESNIRYKYGGPHPEWATHVRWYNK